MDKIHRFVRNIKNSPLRKFFIFIVNIFLIPVRAFIACKYLMPPIGNAVNWLFESRETSNFSYHLTDINNNYLAHTISVVTGSPVKKIKGYISEIENDNNLKRHVTANLKNNPDSFNLGPLVAYGRRVGWYAIIRAAKPKVVVETGVDQGLGSCIIAEALKRNSKEGKKGRYFGTDIWLEAGALFTGIYKKYGEILYGDSIKSLKQFNKKIDLFINDSDHHSIYEGREYGVVSNLLKPESIILGDNSHESEVLSEFAEKTNRNFIFFKEQPKNHWYPGAGIGIAYPRKGNK